MARLKPRMLFSVGGEGRYTAKEAAKKMGIAYNNVYQYAQWGDRLRVVAELRYRVLINGEWKKAYSRKEVLEMLKISSFTMYHSMYGLYGKKYKIEKYWEDVE